MIKHFFIHNWFAILYFNFKMLPLRQAIHLPFDFYGKTRFVDLCGTVQVLSDSLSMGMIKIGSQGSDMFPKTETVLNIKGDIYVGGRLVIGMGSSIVSLPNSKLSFGRNDILGAKNLIYCEKSISFGDNFLTSWDCQIMDSDTHEVVDLETGVCGSAFKEVVVENNVWLGNGVVINKGTRLSSFSIVASRSLCNKDYSGFGGNCILAGSPANVVSRNVMWKL